MRVYRGTWGEDGRIAYVQEGNQIRGLGSDCRVAAAIEWGRHSPGTALLARAILEYTGEDPLCVEALAPSLAELLASLPDHGFALSDEEVRAWIQGEAAAGATNRDVESP